MPLPVITTSEDVLDIINYLKTKPTGVSLEYAKAAIDNRLLDGRKIAAYKFWGVLDRESEKIALSETAWDIARRPEKSVDFFQQIIKDIKPYCSVLEWVYYQKLDELSVVDVARHWSKNFPGESESDEVAKDQAACFFRLCEGAKLGIMRLGRRGSPTRLELELNILATFITGEKHLDTAPVPTASEAQKVETKSENINPIEQTKIIPTAKDVVTMEAKILANKDFYKRVYVSHGKNRSFVEPIRKLLAFGQLDAVVSVQEVSTSVAIPVKIMDEMRSCGAAIIHVDSEDVLSDKSGSERILLNQNVLIEIGAAMALYGKRFILLVRDGLTLPSNLQGLYEVRYSGDALDGDATIRLMETIRLLSQERIPE